MQSQEKYLSLLKSDAAFLKASGLSLVVLIFFAGYLIKFPTAR